MNRNTHTIDAQGQPLGRLATRVAVLLMGKHKPTYTARIDGGDTVRVTNVTRVLLSGKKSEQKEIIHHTWHPGGIKRTPIQRVMEKHPHRVLVHAVSKMLPRNTFRAARLKRLIIQKPV